MSRKKQPGEKAQEPASAAQEPEAEAAPAEPEAEPGEARQPAGATAEPEAPAQADLVAELAREREKATDYMQRWQRAQADLANYRRRVEQEREQLQAFAPVPIFIEILKVLDNYQRAFETLPTELRDFSWVQGVMLTYGYLENLLHVYGVKPLETKAGQAFDPAYHQAVTHEETDAYPDGTITAEYQRGYIFHERVLRPALVRVARPKTTATSAQDTKAGEPQT